MGGRGWLGVPGQGYAAAASGARETWWPRPGGCASLDTCARGKKSEAGQRSVFLIDLRLRVDWVMNGRARKGRAESDKAGVFFWHGTELQSKHYGGLKAN